MTKEQAKSLNLGIQINDKTLIIIETALDLVLAKTSIRFDTKYLELMGIHEGVASQTITNLSMSFSQDKNERFNNLLDEILGDDLISDVKFVGAVNRWQ